VETWLPWIYFGWSPLKAVRDRRFKLIEAPRPELYDLTAVALEASSLDAATHPEARRLRQEMARIESRPGAAPSRSANDEVLERLRALGYVGAGSDEVPVPAGLPDPKDRVQDRDRLTEADRLLRSGRLDAALRLFDGVLAVEPGNRAATLRSGVALLKLGRLESAIERLERSVALDPGRAEARFALGDALMRTGRFRAAATQWAEMARLQPGRFEAWANLGAALLGDGRPAEARDALTRALALRPDDLVTQARREVASGRREEARRALAAALAERPELRSALERDRVLAPLLP